MAKYKKLFEEGDIKNLTHEVLSNHLRHRIGSDDEIHYESTFDSPETSPVHQIHKDLAGIGWNEKSYKDRHSHNRIQGNSETKYIHPSMPGKALEVNHFWRHEPGEDDETDEEGNRTPYSTVHVTYQNIRKLKKTS